MLVAWTEGVDSVEPLSQGQGHTPGSCKDMRGGGYSRDWSTRKSKQFPKTYEAFSFPFCPGFTINLLESVKIITG